MRVVAETTAAVLVTLAFALVPRQLVVRAARLGARHDGGLVRARRRRARAASAARTPRRCCAFTAPLVHFLRVLLGPLANALVVARQPGDPGPHPLAGVSSEEQLLSMVDEATELDVLEEDDRELIHSIFEFGDTVVREVMVPRTDMVTIDDVGAPGAARWRCSSRPGYSRIPVIGRDADEVLGILYLRDVARLGLRAPARRRGPHRRRARAPGGVRARVEEGRRAAAADAARVEPPRDGRRRVRRHRRAS